MFSKTTGNLGPGIMGLGTLGVMPIASQAMISAPLEHPTSASFKGQDRLVHQVDCYEDDVTGMFPSATQ